MKAQVILAAAAVSMGMALAATARDLADPEILEAVKGRRIYLRAPFGGSFPLDYRADGSIAGDGEALGLGRLLQPRDTGRWWVRDGRLCQQFQSWYDGRSTCFTLRKTGPGELFWTRDDGASGVADIGEPSR